MSTVANELKSKTWGYETDDDCFLTSASYANQLTIENGLSPQNGCLAAGGIGPFFSKDNSCLFVVPHTSSLQQKKIWSCVCARKCVRLHCHPCTIAKHTNRLNPFNFTSFQLLSQEKKLGYDLGFYHNRHIQLRSPGTASELSSSAIRSEGQKREGQLNRLVV